MSRLDFFTIFVVALCIIAIIFLIFQATKLARGEEMNSPDRTEFVTDRDDTVADDFADEDDLYDDEEEEEEVEEAIINGGNNSDTETEIGAGADDEDTLYGEEEEATTSAGEKTSTLAAAAETAKIISNDVSLGKYLVISGAFRLEANGAKMAQELRQKGYSNAKTSLFDAGTYAVVLVDRFADRSDAVALVSKLKNDGIEAYVQAVRLR